MNKLEWSDENKDIRNKLIKKYSDDINKKIWSIQKGKEYDVLDNYLEYRFRFLNEIGHIRYDKESYDPQGGAYFPENGAQYAAFNTGLVAKSHYYIWGVYEFKASIWSFYDFFASGFDERKDGNILDKMPLDTGNEFSSLKEIGKKSFDEGWGAINNFCCENLIIRGEHLLQNSNHKKRSSYLSDKLTSCFHFFMNEERLEQPKMDDQKEIIIQLIDHYLRSQSAGDMIEWGHWRWECPSDRTAKDENDFEPLSLLFPIYILTKKREIPDLIVSITIKKQRRSKVVFEVETVLSIEEAYKSAMLVNPGLEKTSWLTHENVMKYIQKRTPKNFNTHNPL